MLEYPEEKCLNLKIIKTVDDLPVNLRPPLQLDTNIINHMDANIYDDNHLNELKPINKNTEEKTDQDTFNACYQKALRMISYREYSCHTMAQKLKLAGYLPEIITKILAKLQEKSYLDDARMAASILHRYQRYGQLKINQIMKKEGILDEIAANAMLKLHAEKDQLMSVANIPILNSSNPSNSLNESHTDDTEFQKACALYQKKFINHALNHSINHINHNNDDDEDNHNDSEADMSEHEVKQILQKNKQKQIRFLIQKGFTYQIALKVIESH